MGINESESERERIGSRRRGQDSAGRSYVEHTRAVHGPHRTDDCTSGRPKNWII